MRARSCPIPFFAALVLALGHAACAAIDPAPGERAHALADGTPEACGVLALLNHPATSFALLDEEVRLDRRSAANLIEHRNGPDGTFATADDDPFDSIAEVDAVPWIGPVALERLTAYALAQGWVPGEDDLLGVYDDVPFTVGEAEMVLALVDTATEQELDLDVGLDRRAVASILAARPIATIARLASLYYVGTSALQRLKAYCVSTCDGGCGPGQACWQDACTDDASAVAAMLEAMHRNIEAEDLPAVMALFSTPAYDPTRPELAQLNAAAWSLDHVQEHFSAMFTSLRDIDFGSLVTGDARGNPYMLLDENTMLIADFTSLEAVVDDPSGGYARVFDFAAGDRWFEEGSEGWNSFLLVKSDSRWQVVSFGQGYQ